MIANYGYKDGSGDWFLTIDTDKCDGCAKCVTACPYGALEVGQEEADPLREEPVAMVTQSHRKKIKYTCSPCKASSQDKSRPPCVVACSPGSISHSW